MTYDIHGQPGLRLCQLASGDLAAVLNLQNQMMDALPDPLWYVLSTRQDQEENLARGDIFGCRQGKTLVAFSVLTPWNARGEKAYAHKLGQPVEDTFDIHDLIVHPDFRRRGIHSAFLQLFEEIARTLNGKALYATIAPDNVPSVAGFEKAGYACVKIQPTYDGRLRGYFRKELR